MTFFVAFVFSLVTLPVSRILVWRLAGGARWWSEPVVVIGTGQRAARAIRALNEARHLGYRPVAVLALAPHTAARDVEGVPLRGGLDAVPGLAAAGIRVALVETDQLLDPATVDRLQRDFRHVVLLRDFDDLPVEGIQVRNLGGVVGIEYTNNLLLYGNRIVKRIVDVVIAGLALLVAAPVIVFASALVRLLDGGPAFFTQDRTGLEGRRIIVPKIRTMRQDAATRLEEHLAAESGAARGMGHALQLRNDPRLIPIVGRFFRRFSVDELPELWAVLDGRMSLVGPRPFPDYHMKNFSQSFLDLRRRVRPGITGLWQVTVRSDGGIDKQESVRHVLHPELVGLARHLRPEPDHRRSGQRPRRVLIGSNRRAWIAAALLAAIVASASLLSVRPGVLGLFHDDGLYAATAKSLASGTGYRLVDLPGSPAETKYPIVYPFILSLLWRVSPTFPGNIMLLKGLNVVTSFAIMLVACALFRRETGRLGIGALLYVVLVGTSSTLIRFTDFTVSDLLFELLVMSALLLHDQPTHDRSSWNVWGGAVVVSLGLLTRELGASLVVAGLAWAVLTRTQREAAIYAVIVVVLVSPWLAWSFRAAASPQPVARLLHELRDTSHCLASLESTTDVAGRIWQPHVSRAVVR